MSKRKYPIKAKCLWCSNDTPNAKYCTNEHQWLHSTQQNIDKWLNGELSGSNKSGYVASWVKPYLIKILGDACQQCGWAERNPVTGRVPIQLEHIDGDPRNNVRDNLMLLCPNCHSLTETFGALNGPVSRSKRGLPIRNERTRPYRAKYE